MGEWAKCGMLREQKMNLPLLEESGEDDEQGRIKEFLLSGNLNCSKEVNEGLCCLLYWGLRREKDLPKSLIENRRVFRS